MQFGADGSLYLLTYGDGFFNINPDAGLYRWDYVKGQRAPKAVLTADKTDGPLAADGQLLERRLPGCGPERLDPLRVGLRRRLAALRPRPTRRTPTRSAGRFTAVLTVIDSSGKQTSTATLITVGQHQPDGRRSPLRSTAACSRSATRSSTRSRSPIRRTARSTAATSSRRSCSATTPTATPRRARTGCTGFLHTDAADVAHGGNVFGVISATYTDKGSAGRRSAAVHDHPGPDPSEASRRSSTSSTSPARRRRPTPTPPASGPRAPQQHRHDRLAAAERSVQPAPDRHRRDPLRGRRRRSHRGLAAGCGSTSVRTRSRVRSSPRRT